MTQSGLMFALAGPKPKVTLVPAGVLAIPLFSVQSQTMVLFYGFPGAVSCQNASHTLTIRVSLERADFSGRTRVWRVLAGEMGRGGERSRACARRTLRLRSGQAPSKLRAGGLGGRPYMN